jgi:hypothetical protein
VLSHENLLKNALFTTNNVNLRFYERDFWPKQKNTGLMIMNDKPNCQVSRILMNPRPILSDSSENAPMALLSEN